jgi:hypothetical protein
MHNRIQRLNLYETSSIIIAINYTARQMIQITRHKNVPSPMEPIGVNLEATQVTPVKPSTPAEIPNAKIQKPFLAV